MNSVETELCPRAAHSRCISLTEDRAEEEAAAEEAAARLEVNIPQVVAVPADRTAVTLTLAWSPLIVRPAAQAAEVDSTLTWADRASSKARILVKPSVSSDRRIILRCKAACPSSPRETGSQTRPLCISISATHSSSSRIIIHRSSTILRSTGSSPTVTIHLSSTLPRGPQVTTDLISPTVRDHRLLRRSAGWCLESDRDMEADRHREDITTKRHRRRDIKRRKTLAQQSSARILSRSRSARALPHCKLLAQPLSSLLPLIAQCSKRLFKRTALASSPSACLLIARARATQQFAKGSKLRVSRSSDISIVQSPVKCVFVIDRCADASTACS